MHFADELTRLEFLAGDEVLVLIDVVSNLSLRVTLGVETHLASQVLKSHILVGLKRNAEVSKARGGDLGHSVVGQGQ